MSKFMQLGADAPATLGAVVEAVTRLSTLDEAQILEQVSAGNLQELFPFSPTRAPALPSDTVAEEELKEASAAPLNRKQRAALMQASLPTASSLRSRRVGRARALKRSPVDN